MVINDIPRNHIEQHFVIDFNYYAAKYLKIEKNKKSKSLSLKRVPLNRSGFASNKHLSFTIFLNTVPILLYVNI